MKPKNFLPAFLLLCLCFSNQVFASSQHVKNTIAYEDLATPERAYFKDLIELADESSEDLPQELKPISSFKTSKQKQKQIDETLFTNFLELRDLLLNSQLPIELHLYIPEPTTMNPSAVRIHRVKPLKADGHCRPKDSTRTHENLPGICVLYDKWDEDSFSISSDLKVVNKKGPYRVKVPQNWFAEDLKSHVIIVKMTFQSDDKVLLLDKMTVTRFHFSSSDTL